MRILILPIAILWSLKGQAQGESIANLFRVDYETPLTIELKKSKPEEEVIEPVAKKEKKKNPKIYYGIKAKRGYTRSGFGKNSVTELFHYLKPKDFEGPGLYDREFYYYDFKKRKIVNSLKIPESGRIGVMHGHYEKKIGDQVLEEGYFYKGRKHRRWVRYNRHDILQDKKIYWKGWPEQSLLSFYDFEKEKIREVIPVHFGERNGMYYAFHENGNLAVMGEYKYDVKVGVWREYYPNRRMKREVTYPDDPYDNRSAYINKEWDRDGRLIYDRVKFITGAGPP